LKTGDQGDRGHLVYLIGAFVVIAFLAGTFIANPGVVNGLGIGSTYTPVTRHFTLMVEGTDIPEGPNAVWHAWTYNGTVPGPTLHAWVGDKIIVTVYNHLNLTVSFHTHFVNYNFTSDGSQANVIAGMGVGSMIPPGQNYTYYFTAVYAGVFEYHDHSSDQYSIPYHMGQGLYGIIVIDDPKNPPPKLAHDWTVSMAEIGPRVSGTGYAPYIMDSMGFPGGEPALVNLFAAQGLPGVAAQFNKTLLTFEATVGDTVRFDLFNPGAYLGLTHTFHLHDSEMISEFADPGVPVPDAVVPLDPGVTEAILVTLDTPGVFLFHCHVVPHADAGMIGVLVVLPKSSSGSTSSSSTSSTLSSSLTSTSAISLTSLTSTTQSNTATSGVSILANAGTNPSSLGFSPDVIHVVVGVNNTVMWTNHDNAVHTVTSTTDAFDSGFINPGQSWTYTFTKDGTYNYHCTLHNWMSGTVIVTG
jgi:FtsP/CotA-like multicopper oxidase with cupredoxin domain